MKPIQDRIIKDFDKIIIGIMNDTLSLEGLNADRFTMAVIEHQENNFVTIAKQFLIQSIKEVEEETRKETLGEEKLINGKIYKTYLANAWCYNCNKIIQFNVPKGYKVSNALSPLVVNEYKPKCPICDTQSLRKLTEKEKLSITNK